MQMSQQMIGTMLAANQLNQMKLAGQKGPQSNPVSKSGLSYKKRMQNQNAQQNSKV